MRRVSLYIAPSALRFLLPLVVAGMCFHAGRTEAQVLLDFETAGQFANSFRKISVAGTDSAAQTSNVSPTNNYVAYDRIVSSSSGVVYLYDTTPLDTTAGTQSVFSTATTLTISLDFRSAAATSSIGIYFADPSNADNNLLALFNLDNTGTTDVFRFFRDGAVLNALPGTQVGSTQSVSSGVNAGAPTFSLLTATLSVTGTTPTLSLSFGSQSFTQTFAAGDFNFLGGNTTVALRLFDPVTTVSPVDIDNFAVSVPEPSPGLMIAIALGLCSIVRRRRLK